MDDSSGKLQEEVMLNWENSLFDIPSILGINNTSNTSYNRNSTTSSLWEPPPTTLCLILILTNIVAIVTNIGLALVMGCIKNLRETTGSKFVINLCVIDTFASASVLPKAIWVSLTTEAHWPKIVCSLGGFIHWWIVCSSILAVCSIHLEKYYCIKHPIHHANHMTRTKTLVLIVSIWCLGGLVAAFPLHWDIYAFTNSFHHFTVLWTRRKPQVVHFTIIVFVLFYLAPVICMLVTNVMVYKIAKDSKNRIEPFPANLAMSKRNSPQIVILRPSNDHGSAEFKSPTHCDKIWDVFSVERDSTNSHELGLLNQTNIDMLKPDTDRNAAIQLDRACARININRMPQRQSTANFKALKSLLIPFVYFLAIWTFYFIPNLCWTLHIPLLRKDIFETLSTFSVYLSFGINPFIYGYINKHVRTETMATLKRLCFSGDRSEVLRSVRPSAAPSCENFLQFLERTAYSPQIRP